MHTDKTSTNIRWFKIVGIAFALCAMLLFAGCAQIDFAAGIDEAYNVTMTYHVELQLDNLSEKQRENVTAGLESLIEYHQAENGLKLQYQREQDGAYIFDLARTRSHSSYEAAFDTLTSWLQNESMTPFLTFDAVYENPGAQQYAALSGSIDIVKLFKMSNIEDFPPTLRQQLWDGLESSTGTVTLSLPASYVENASGEVTMDGNLATMTQPLAYGEATDLDFSVRLTELRDVIYPGYTSDATKPMYTVAIVAGVALLAALALAIVSIRGIRKNQRKKKAEQEQLAAQAAAAPVYGAGMYPPPAPFAPPYPPAMPGAAAPAMPPVSSGDIGAVPPPVAPFTPTYPSAVPSATSIPTAALLVSPGDVGATPPAPLAPTYPSDMPSAVPAPTAASPASPDSTGVPPLAVPLSPPVSPASDAPYTEEPDKE